VVGVERRQVLASAAGREVGVAHRHGHRGVAKPVLHLTYDVLRWDGRCYTLDGDEITTTQPPQARTARLQWDRIGAAMQHAVLKNEDVKRAFDRRNKAFQVGLARRPAARVRRGGRHPRLRRRQPRTHRRRPA
jgi:hypothetical protein